MRRPNWTVVLTPSGFAAVPVGAVESRARLMYRQHAEQIAEKMNADVVTADVARRFGGEVAA